MFQRLNHLLIHVTSLYLPFFPTSQHSPKMEALSLLGSLLPLSSLYPSMPVLQPSASDLTLMNCSDVKVRRAQVSVFVSIPCLLSCLCDLPSIFHIRVSSLWGLMHDRVGQLDSTLHFYPHTGSLGQRAAEEWEARRVVADKIAGPIHPGHLPLPRVGPPDIPHQS